jgi:hypothetical protein
MLLGPIFLTVTDFGVRISWENTAVSQLRWWLKRPLQAVCLELPQAPKNAETSAPSAKSLWLLELQPASRRSPSITRSPQNP